MADDQKELTGHVNRLCIILIPESADENSFMERTGWLRVSERYGLEIEVLSCNWNAAETAERCFKEGLGKLKNRCSGELQIYLIGYEDGAAFAAREAVSHTCRYTGLVMIGLCGRGAAPKPARESSPESGCAPIPEPVPEPLSVWIISSERSSEVDDNISFWNCVNSITGHGRKCYRTDYADEVYLPPASKAGKITSDSSRMGIVLFSIKNDYYDPAISESIAWNFVFRIESGHVCFPGEISGGEIRPISDRHFFYNRMQFKGQQRDYWIYIPENVMAEVMDAMGPVPKPSMTSCPLILCLHGNMESGEDMIFRTQWHKTAAENNCIVLYPSCLFKTGARHIWQILPEELGFLRALIGRVKSSFPVDASRIYVTGFSNGSCMAQNLIIRCSDIFAAAVLAAPAYYEKELYGPLDEIHEGAALYSYGTQDEYLISNHLSYGIYGVPALLRFQHWRRLYGFSQDSYEYSKTDTAITYTFRSLNNIPVCHWIIVKGKHHDYTADEVPAYYEFLKHYTRGSDGGLYYDGIRVESCHTLGENWDEYTQM